MCCNGFVLVCSEFTMGHNGRLLVAMGWNECVMVGNLFAMSYNGW